MGHSLRDDYAYVTRVVHAAGLHDAPSPKQRFLILAHLLDSFCAYFTDGNSPIRATVAKAYLEKAQQGILSHGAPKKDADMLAHTCTLEIGDLFAEMRPLKEGPAQDVAEMALYFVESMNKTDALAKKNIAVNAGTRNPFIALRIAGEVLSNIHRTGTDRLFASHAFHDPLHNIENFHKEIVRYYPVHLSLTDQDMPSQTAKEVLHALYTLASVLDDFLMKRMGSPGAPIDKDVIALYALKKFTAPFRQTGGPTKEIEEGCVVLSLRAAFNERQEKLRAGKAKSPAPEFSF